MVSLDDHKVNGPNPEEWTRKARAMAELLRPLAGVRQVEAIVFRYWREGKSKIYDAPPWRPVGALVIVEGKDEQDLETNVEAVWTTAGQIDQRGVVTRAVDNW